MDTELAAARLRLATEQAEALQCGLHQRQEDLLALEASGHNLQDGHCDGMLVVDQAEDLRRTVTVHAIDQLADIRLALTDIDLRIADAALRSAEPTEAERAVDDLVTTTIGEARRTKHSLDDVSQALAPIASALPGEPDLAQATQAGVEEAIGHLEQARRSLFRLNEGLPAITRAVETMPADEQVALDLDVAADATVSPGGRRGVEAEQREPPVTDRAHDVGFSPGY